MIFCIKNPRIHLNPRESTLVSPLNPPMSWYSIYCFILFMYCHVVPLGTDFGAKCRRRILVQTWRRSLEETGRVRKLDQKIKECTWDETTIDYRLQQPRYIRTTMHIIYKQHHQQQNHHTWQTKEQRQAPPSRMEELKYHASLTPQMRHSFFEWIFHTLVCWVRHGLLFFNTRSIRSQLVFCFCWNGVTLGSMLLYNANRETRGARVYIRNL